MHNAAREERLTEIGNKVVQQQVLGLEVPVEDAVAVAVGHALAELVHEALEKGGGEGPLVRPLAVGVYELLQVRVQVLEHQVQVRLGLALLLLLLRRLCVCVGVGGFLVAVSSARRRRGGGIGDVLDGEEADDVEGLGEHLEEGDLAEGDRGDSLLVHL